MRALIPLMAAVLFGAMSLPLDAQDVDHFMDSVREVDPEAELVLEAAYESDGVAVVTVADSWKSLSCERQEKIAGTLRVLWERTGGDRLVLENDDEWFAGPAPARPNTSFIVKGCV